MRTKIEMFNSNKQCSETDKKLDGQVEENIQTQKERCRYRKKDTDIERRIQTQKERYKHRKKDRQTENQNEKHPDRSKKPTSNGKRAS